MLRLKILKNSQNNSQKTLKTTKKMTSDKRIVSIYIRNRNSNPSRSQRLTLAFERWKWRMNGRNFFLQHLNVDNWCSNISLNLEYMLSGYSNDCPWSSNARLISPLFSMLLLWMFERSFTAFKRSSLFRPFLFLRSL